jgi:cytochrome c553
MVATKTQAKEATPVSSANGKALYVKCAGCHGQTGQKAALGKSAVITGWDKAKTITALNGYKAGTYGGVMKGVMKSQVVNLSDEEVDALGVYISSF